MYANLNTTHKLVVSKVSISGVRYRYDIVSKATGRIEYSKFCSRKFVAASTSGANFYSRIELIERDKAFFKSTGVNVSYAFIEDNNAFQEATAYRVGQANVRPAYKHL